MSDQRVELTPEYRFTVDGKEVSLETFVWVFNRDRKKLKLAVEIAKEAIGEFGPCGNTAEKERGRCLHGVRIFRVPCPVAEWKKALQDIEKGVEK